MNVTPRKQGWTNAVGAFFAATLALAFSLLAVEQSRIDPLPRLAAIGSEAAPGTPFEFDPLLATSHYAIQPRSNDRGKDGSPPDLASATLPDQHSAIFHHAVGAAMLASVIRPRLASHADARAPPVTILTSATL
jgi:hypothetical protein